MAKTPKMLIVSAIAMLTTSFAIAPAHAQETGFDFTNTPTLAAAHFTTPELVAINTELVKNSLAELSTAAAVVPQTIAHNYDVATAITQAKSELGTTRPTGWSQPGECIMSVKRWVLAGGANWGGGGSPVTNFNNAVRLPLSAAKAGDIIQFEHLKYPHSYASGVHTMLVTAAHPDGTLDIIESNFTSRGLVSERIGVKITPPQGFQAVVWRY